MTRNTVQYNNHHAIYSHDEHFSGSLLSCTLLNGSLCLHSMLWHYCVDKTSAFVNQCMVMPLHRMSTKMRVLCML